MSEEDKIEEKRKLKPFIDDLKTSIKNGKERISELIAIRNEPKKLADSRNRLFKLQKQKETLTSMINDTEKFRDGMNIDIKSPTSEQLLANRSMANSQDAQYNYNSDDIAKVEKESEDEIDIDKDSADREELLNELDKKGLLNEDEKNFLNEIRGDDEQAKSVYDSLLGYLNCIME